MRFRIPAAAVLAAALATASSAGAFEVKHSQEGELVRWRRAKVAWTVDSTIKDVTGGEEAVKAALGAWTKRGGAPGLVVDSTWRTLTPGFDGTSAVFYARDGFPLAGDALAVTLLTFDDRTGEVLDADIVLNGKYDFGVVDDTSAAPAASRRRAARTYDVGRVVAHEMGHALGLGDEPEHEEALMYPFVAPSRALPTTPSKDDLAGLVALYVQPGSSAAPAEASAGCGGAVVARSGPGCAPGVASCAVGLLVAALVLARNKRRGGHRAAGCTVLAAAALFVLPASSSAAREPPAVSSPGATLAVDAQAVVTSVKTTITNGVFRSELEFATTRCVAVWCPSVSRAEVLGGTISGLRQVVGDTAVPSIGDQFGVVLAAREGDVREGIVRVMSRVRP